MFTWAEGVGDECTLGVDNDDVCRCSARCGVAIAGEGQMTGTGVLQVDPCSEQ